jgi:hypothetical protein
MLQPFYHTGANFDDCARLLTDVCVFVSVCQCVASVRSTCVYLFDLISGLNIEGYHIVQILSVTWP